MRTETHADGQLVSAREIKDVAGVLRTIMYDATGRVTEDRVATDGEASEYAAHRAMVNRSSIEQQAQTALGNNRTYLALGSPTAAQNLAQIRALSRQNNGIIRLLLNQLDGTD